MGTTTMLSAGEYATIVEQAPVLIWRANSSGKCDYFNDRWLQFRGRTMEQEIGDAWADGVHPDDRARCLQEWRSHFEARSSFELDYRLLRHDGEYCWIHDCGGPVYLADGEFAGFIGSCVDLTVLMAHASAGMRRELRSLRGLLSVCSWCYRVEDEHGAWTEIERYLAERSSLEVTHGICPRCLATQGAEA